MNEGGDFPILPLERLPQIPPRGCLNAAGLLLELISGRDCRRERKSGVSSPPAEYSTRCLRLFIPIPRTSESGIGWDYTEPNVPVSIGSLHTLLVPVLDRLFGSLDPNTSNAAFRCVNSTAECCAVAFFLCVHCRDASAREFPSHGPVPSGTERDTEARPTAFVYCFEG